MDTITVKTTDEGPITTIITTKLPITVTKTIVETLTSTLTSSITASAATTATDDGPYYFTVSNGTTIWLGSMTPAPTVTAVKTVVSTLAVLPVPISNHKPSTYAQSEQTITLESTSTRFLTKTVTVRSSYEKTSTVTYGPFATLSVSGLMGVSFTGVDGSATNYLTDGASAFGTSASQSAQTLGGTGVSLATAATSTTASMVAGGITGISPISTNAPYGNLSVSVLGGPSSSIVSSIAPSTRSTAFGTVTGSQTSQIVANTTTTLSTVSQSSSTKQNTGSVNIATSTNGTLASSVSTVSVNPAASQTSGSYRIPLVNEKNVLNKRQLGATVTATINGGMIPP